MTTPRGLLRASLVVHLDLTEDEAQALHNGTVGEALVSAQNKILDELARLARDEGESVETHEITIGFASPHQREDGAIVQLEIATCSCGWKTEPLSYWDVRASASAHAKRSWRESRDPT